MISQTTNEWYSGYSLLKFGGVDERDTNHPLKCGWLGGPFGVPLKPHQTAQGWFSVVVVFKPSKNALKCISIDTYPFYVPVDHSEKFDQFANRAVSSRLGRMKRPYCRAAALQKEAQQGCVKAGFT